MSATVGLNHVSTRALKRAEKELSQTKVIIRRLPPDFTEEKLREVINPLPANNMFYFSPGDQSLGKFGCARAYINFVMESDIVQFRDEYDGMVLESQKGAKYRLVIEYAPFQGIPRRSRKTDPRCGTIQHDSEYKNFLEEYEKGATPLPSVDISYLELLDANRVPQVKMTPLVEFIKEKRAPKPKKNKVIYAADSKRKREKEKKAKDGESRGKSAGKDKGKATEKPKGSHSSRKNDKERSKKNVKSQSEDGVFVEANSPREPDQKQSSRSASSLHSASKSEAGHIHSPADDQTRPKPDREGSSSSRGEKEKSRRAKGRPDQQFYVPKGARRQGTESKDKESSPASSKKDVFRPSTGKEHPTKEGREPSKPKSASHGGHRYSDRYASSRDYEFSDHYGDDYRSSGGRRGQSRRDHDSSYDQYYWDEGGGGSYEYEDQRKERGKKSRDYSRGYYQGGSSSSHGKSNRSYK